MYIQSMEINEGFDDQMDALPPSLRRKVLDHLFVELEPEPEAETMPKWGFWKNLLWVTLMAASLILSAAAILPGLFLTVVAPPIGLLILGGIGSMNAALIAWRFNLSRHNTDEA